MEYLKNLNEIIIDVIIIIVVIIILSYPFNSDIYIILIVCNFNLFYIYSNLFVKRCQRNALLSAAMR